jgi:hypothetical protein
VLSSIRALVVGAVVTGLTAVFFGGAAPAAAQCAPGSLISFDGTAESSEPGESPTRTPWTFRIDTQPTGLTLPNPVVVAVEGTLGDPLEVGTRYRATVQLIVASDGNPSYVADACGGNFQRLAETVAAPTTVTTVPLFETSTRTTVSAEHEAQSAWKFLVGGLGIVAVVGGVLKTATGRRRE